MANETFTTPKCVVEYPHLQQQQPAQGKFKACYKITAVLDSKNEAHKELLGQIKKLGSEKNKELKTGDSKFPIKFHVDENGNKTGLYTVTFKTGYGPVGTFDAKAQVILREKNFIANGSQCKISWSYGFYDEGVSLYLKAVQVIDLIEWKGGSAEDYGFGKEEGHEEVQTTEDQTPAEIAQAEMDDMEGEELPF